MVEGVVAVDKSETIIHLNEAAARIFGISSKKNIHRRIWEVTHSQELCQVFSEALNEEAEITKKLKIVTILIFQQASQKIIYTLIVHKKTL